MTIRDLKQVRLSIKNMTRLMAISVVLIGCGNDCVRPSNPFPELQYVLEAQGADGILIHSVEWMNIVNSNKSDTLRIIAKAVLFDEPGGAITNSGSISLNGSALSRSTDGEFTLEIQPGNFGPFNGSATWRIDGANGHDDFSQEFEFQASTFFNLDQEFSDIRTNSEFFISADRPVNGDEVYVFLCGSIDCLASQVNPASRGDHYTLSELESVGIGNGLIQVTNRLVERVTIGNKTYAIVFQTSTAYQIEIIEGNEPKCDD